MSLEDFNRIKVIGKGSYGEVWLANHKKDHKKQYVLKKMNLQKASKRERKSAELEAKLLSKLKHPNIVSYKDSFETENGYLYIAMQYCEGGDLYNKLKDQKGVPLEERQVVEWFIQISMALQYLHERNILHRDLKTQNIFLTKSKIIKIGDLGIARVLESSNDMASTLIGTPYYMSPELFSNKRYNHKSDVWALGCCVYEMATLKHAFNAKDMNALVYKILQGKMPVMPRKYSVELLSLIKQMLHQDPNKRPSVNKILRDAYIKKNIQIFLDDTKKNCRPSTSGKSRPGSAVSVRSVSSVVPSVSTPHSHSHSKPVATPSAVVSSPQATPVHSPSKFNHKSESKPTPSSSSSSADASIDSKPLNVDSSDQVDSVTVSHRSQDQLDSRPSSASRNRRGQSPPRNSSRSDLEPIEEKLHIPASGDASANSNVDSAELNMVEGKKKKDNIAPKKRPYLKRLKSKGEENDDNSDASSISSVKSSSSTKSIFKNPKPVEKHRPLPTPKAVESSGLPQRRSENKESKSTDSSSISSGVSSSKEDGDVDTPVHSSLPNLSARERRRVKSSISSSADHSHCAKIKLRKPVERRSSEKITESEKNQVDAENIFPSVVKKAIRQPSINDESSSSSEDLLLAGDSKEIEKRRENKEMNNFITLLDTTLHQEREKTDEDDEEDEAETLKPIEEIEEQDMVDHPASNTLQKPSDTMHKSMSMPSVETLCDNSRLMKRIRQLHSDCVKGVGYEKIKEAYKILNKIDEDEVEPKLVALLGKDKYDEFAGKIWQLKFCEESLFLPS